MTYTQHCIPFLDSTHGSVRSSAPGLRLQGSREPTEGLSAGAAVSAEGSAAVGRVPLRPRSLPLPVALGSLCPQLCGLSTGPRHDTAASSLQSSQSQKRVSHLSPNRSHSSLKT